MQPGRTGHPVLRIPTVSMGAGSMGGGRPPCPSCPVLSRQDQWGGGCPLPSPGGTDAIPGFINWGHGPPRCGARRTRLIPDPLPRTLSPGQPDRRAGPGVPSVRARPAPTPEWASPSTLPPPGGCENPPGRPRRRAGGRIGAGIRGTSGKVSHGRITPAKGLLTPESVF